MQYDTFAHIVRELHRIEQCRYGNNLTEEIKDFLEKVVLLAKRTDTVLELNESSLVNNEVGPMKEYFFGLRNQKRK